MKWTEVAIVLVIVIAFAGFITVLATDDPSFEAKAGEDLSPINNLLYEIEQVCIPGQKDEENKIYSNILRSGQSIHQANLLITRAIRNTGFTPCSTTISPDSTLSFYFTDNNEQICITVDF